MSKKWYLYEILDKLDMYFSNGNGNFKNFVLCKSDKIGGLGNYMLRTCYCRKKEKIQDRFLFDSDNLVVIIGFDVHLKKERLKENKTYNIDEYKTKMQIIITDIDNYISEKKWCEEIGYDNIFIWYGKEDKFVEEI